MSNEEKVLLKRPRLKNIKRFVVSAKLQLTLMKGMNLLQFKSLQAEMKFYLQQNKVSVLSLANKKFELYLETPVELEVLLLKKATML